MKGILRYRRLCAWFIAVLLVAMSFPLSAVADDSAMTGDGQLLEQGEQEGAPVDGDSASGDPIDGEGNPSDPGDPEGLGEAGNGFAGEVLTMAADDDFIHLTGSTMVDWNPLCDMPTTVRVQVKVRDYDGESLGEVYFKIFRVSGLWEPDIPAVRAELDAAEFELVFEDVVLQPGTYTIRASRDADFGTVYAVVNFKVADKSANNLNYLFVGTSTNDRTEYQFVDRDIDSIEISLQGHAADMGALSVWYLGDDGVYVEMDGQRQASPFTADFSEGSVTITAVSYDETTRTDYQLTVYNRQQGEVYMEHIAVVYPVYDDNGSFRYEEARGVFERGNHIAIQPRYRLLREIPDEMYGTDWYLDIGLSDDAAIIWAGQMAYNKDNFPKTLLLDGPCAVTLTSGDGVHSADYVIDLRNALSWRTDFVDELRPEPDNGWDNEEGSTLQYVEPSGEINRDTELYIRFKEEDFFRYVPELEGKEIEEITLRFGVNDFQHGAHEEYIRIEDGRVPETIHCPMRPSELAPGTYNIGLEFYYYDEGHRDWPNSTRLAVGGITLGDPDYEPYTEMPDTGNYALTFGTEVVNGEVRETITFTFEAYNTDVDELTVGMSLRLSENSSSGMGSHHVRLDGDYGLRRGEVTFERAGFEAGNYEITANLNPGRWHEALCRDNFLYGFVVGDDDTLFHTFSLYGERAYIDHSAGAVTLTLIDNVDPVSAPQFTVADGSTVWVGDERQISGVTAQDFTAPVTYTVKNASGDASRDYEVAVHWQDARTAALIRGFFVGEHYAAPNNENFTIDLHLPYDRNIDLAAVTPRFEVSDGATSVPDWRNPGPMNFANGPQTIVVTSEDGNTVNTYTVAVTMDAGSSDNELIRFWGAFRTRSSEYRNYYADIDHEAGTVHFALDYDLQPPSHVSVYYEIPQGATASRAVGVWNLTNPYVFYVTAQDGSIKSYRVTTNIEPEKEFTVEGTVASYVSGQLQPAPDYTMTIYNAVGGVSGTVTTDNEGYFSLDVMESQYKHVYIAVGQEIGTLLNDDESGFVSGNYTYLEPGSRYDLVFSGANLNAVTLRGTVVDANSRGGIAGASISYISELLTTGPDGSFSFTVDRSWIGHHSTSFTVGRSGYHSARFTVTAFKGDDLRSLLQRGYIDVGEIELQPVATGIPLESYWVRALQQYAQRGTPAEVSIHYTAAQRIEGAELSISIPAGIDFVSVSHPDAVFEGRAVVITQTLEPGEDYTLKLWVTAPADYAQDHFIVEPMLATGGRSYGMGAATVALVGLTMELPEQVSINETTGHSEPFTIRGEATADDSYKLRFEIGLGGEPVQVSRSLDNLPTTGVGPWYTVDDVRVQYAADNPGLHEVTAYLVDPDGNDVDSVTKYINIVPDALKLTGIRMTSRYFDVSAPAPVTNSSYVAACAYVEMDYTGRDAITITTRWNHYQNADAVRYVMVTSMGSYEAQLTGSEGGSYIGYYPSRSYKGAGPANLYIVFTMEDGTQLTFMVAQLMLLIDPSGYVYDVETGNRIPGATAVLEVKREEAWTIWEAESFGQHNYQTTDENGEYGWFVPEGEYRVLVSAAGYLDYNTEADPAYGVLQIPPPRDDVNIGLTPIASETPVLVELSLGGNYRTTYTEGETLDLGGLVVTARYSNGEHRPVSGYTTFPTADTALTPSHRSVVVSYTEDGVTRTASYDITVESQYALERIALSGSYKTNYTAGDALDLSGLLVTAHYSNGTSAPVTGYTTAPAAGTALTTANSYVAVSYSEGGVTRTATYAITVSGASNDTAESRRRSGGSMGGGSTTSVAPAAVSDPLATAPSAGPLEMAQARELAARALRGVSGGTVNVGVKNIGLITVEVAGEMLSAAEVRPLRIIADTTRNNGAVDVRIAFDADAVAQAINPRAATHSTEAKQVAGWFRSWFANANLMAMSMEQTGDLGMDVAVAFKLDDALIGAPELHLYYYDRERGRYHVVAGRQDNNGYLHFTTSTGGDFIVSDEPLLPR